MSKPFKLLKEKMSPEARQAIEKKTKQLLREMLLQELRHSRNVSQEQLAKTLLTKQANISRIERRPDMRISTLRSFIEAMGGQLEIFARFPEGEIRINQF